jgi:predicted RNase H-like HicB family nuclease
VDKIMLFHVIIEQAEDGWFVAECPALPGCVSQGKDENDALENMKEAITAWLWAEDKKAISDLPQKLNIQPIIVSV